MGDRNSYLLRPGAIFKGTQGSNAHPNTTFPVEVVLHHCDLERSFLCGFLTVRNMAADIKVLATFFEAEIIGDRYGFLTRKWDTDAEIDRIHWSQFSCFRGFADMSADEGFDPFGSRYIFMRWKEKFLVPDHTVQVVPGASFSGFYYICMDRETGVIEGYYYPNVQDNLQYLRVAYSGSPTHEFFEFR